MNHYELLFVVKPTLTEDEIKDQIKKMEDNITGQDGEIVSVKDMGMRKLAYPVEKNERGYYTVIYFKAPGTAIAEIERLIRINEDMLKFLTVKFTNKKEVAQFDKMATQKVEKINPPVQENAPEVDVVVDDATIEKAAEEVVVAEEATTSDVKTETVEAVVEVTETVEAK